MRIRSFGNVHGPFARATMWMILAACASIHWLCLQNLANTPRLGASLRTEGEVVQIGHLEPNSPVAQAGFIDGDTVSRVEGRKVDRAAFLEDHDQASSWAERDSCDSWRRHLSDQARDGTLRLAVRRQGRELSSSVPLESMGWMRALGRTWAMSLVGWAFFAAAWMIWRLKKGQAALVNLVGGVGVLVTMVTTTSLFGFDYTFNVGNTGAFLIVVNFLAAQSALTTMHLVQVFPTPMPWVRRHRELLAIPWILCALVTISHFGRWFPGPLPTAYVVGPVGLLISLAIWIVRFLVSKDPIEYRQLQWVALGGSAGFLPWVLLSALPLAFGHKGAPQEWTLLSAICLPVCLTFAVLRYRLLDVGQIVDGVLLHSATIAILSLGEFAFWSWLGETFNPAHRPLAMGIGMTMLVFLYAPVRHFLSGRMQRLLGRSRPLVDEAVRRLLDQVSENEDPWNALENTLPWALPVSRIEWIDPCADGLLDSPQGLLGAELGLTGRHAEALWIPCRREGRCLALAISTHDSGGWSRPDLRLATNLVRAAEPLGLLEEMRRGHERREAALHEQRLSILREMHDGIGSQLFGISILAGPGAEASESSLRERLGEIQRAASHAQDSLRTGLRVMDAPPESFGPVLAALLVRAETVFSAASLALHTRVPDEIAGLRLDSRRSFGLLRALQEGLTNAVRHSHAGTVAVHATLADRLLCLEIADDGVGFDVHHASTGQGLSNIHQRLAALGGRARVDSTPGRGTRIALELPLDS